MRRTTTAAIVAALGITLMTVLAAPAGAEVPSSAPTCSGTLTPADLATGCVVDSGRLVLPDGRTFAVPAAGTSVAALPVAVAGVPDDGDVVVTNTGAAGVAVRVDDTWAGSPAAVTGNVPPSSAGRSRRRSAGGSAPVPRRPPRPRPLRPRPRRRRRARTVSYSLAGHRWKTTVGWRYNKANEKTLAADSSPTARTPGPARSPRAGRP